MKKQLIIFDMDGTLIDSSQVIAGAINHVRQHLSLHPMESETIIQAINDHTLRPAEFFYNATHFEPQHEAWFSSYYSDNHHKEIALYGGILELLEGLKSKGITLAVATNAYRISAIESLCHTKIDHFFDSIVCFDDVPRGKPYPDMLHKILTDLGIEGERSLMVGDGERDRLAAQSAMVDFLMVNWGFSDHDEALGSVDELVKRLG